MRDRADLCPACGAPDHSLAYFVSKTKAGSGWGGQLTGADRTLLSDDGYVCVCVCVCAVLRPAEGPDDRKVIAYKKENQEQARAARQHHHAEKTLEKARGDAEATVKQRKLERKVQKRRERLLLQQQQQAASGPGPARNTTAHNGITKQTAKSKYCFITDAFAGKGFGGYRLRLVLRFQMPVSRP